MRQLRFSVPEEDPLPVPSQEEPGVHVWHTTEGGVVAFGYEGGGFCWMHWPFLATYRFSSSDPFIVAFPQPGASREVVYDTYRRSVLPMALQAIGFEALHASAVVAADGIVAFAAVSKTGKSTIAFGLSRRGYAQWADDSVVFRAAGHAPEALPLGFRVRLRPTSIAMFGPELSLSSGTSDRAEAGKDPTPITALCLLSRLDAEASDHAARIRLLTPAAAFPAVLTHAHVFDPSNIERRQRMLEAYLKLVASVPVYEVAFKTGPEHFQDVLDAVVARFELASPAERELALAR